LQLILTNRRIQNLIVMGVTTDVCVHTTIREANDLGYECLMVEDATNAATRQNHNSAISMIRKSGGIFGATATTDKVLEILGSLPDCYLYDEKVNWETVNTLKLKSVSVGKDGAAWGLTASHEIHRYEGNGKWTHIDGSLRQIDVVSNDNVWGVNNKCEVWNWNGSNWKQEKGYFKQVSAGKDAVWAIDVDDQVFRLEGKEWKQIPGSLKQIDVADPNNIWGVNANNEVFQWLSDKSQWQQYYGRIKQISVSSNGTVHGVDPEDDIFNFQEGQWIQIQGKLRQISVSDKQVWGTTSDDQVLTYRF